MNKEKCLFLNSFYLMFFIALFFHAIILSIICFDWSMHDKKTQGIIQTYLYKKNFQDQEEKRSIVNSGSFLKLTSQLEISSLRSSEKSFLEKPKKNAQDSLMLDSAHPKTPYQAIFQADSKKALTPFLVLLHNKLAQQLIYPEQAELLHLKGEVGLCFRINNQGKLSDLNFCPASPYAFFNTAAQEAGLAIELSPLEMQQMDQDIFRVNLVFE
jgi:TonB family protein